VLKGGTAAAGQQAPQPSTHRREAPIAPPAQWSRRGFGRPRAGCGVTLAQDWHALSGFQGLKPYGERLLRECGQGYLQQISTRSETATIIEFSSKLRRERPWTNTDATSRWPVAGSGK
jgi:hypothetical protein